MQDRIFYSISFGFLFGVFIASFFNLDFYFNLLFVLLSFVSTLFFYLISKNKWGMIISFFILFIFLGILRFSFLNNKEPVSFLEENVGNTLELNGIVVDEVDKRENNQKLIIEIKSGKKENKVLLSTDFENNFNYGDEVNFTGKLEKPENFVTDAGKEFDYVSYLEKDGILYIMNYPKVEILSHDNGNFLKSFLFRVKNSFIEKTNIAIQPPESILLNGLILGERSSFPDELKDNFIKTGTIHIVALSGYNVTIVAEWFMKFLYFLPEVLAIYGGIIIIFLFVLMTGAASTSIRAGIMAILVLIARATGRNYDVARGLILAAFCMVLINPYVLVFDISFQLSFIATFAVIFFTPRIEKYFLWITKKFALRDIVSVTFSAYVFVLPFILYKMGNLSLVAFPTNVLILPLIPITMLLGFFTGILGFIIPFISILFGYITYLILHYELFIIDLFASFTFSSFIIPDFPLVLTILIYLYFIHILFGKNIYRFFRKIS